MERAKTIRQKIRRLFFLLGITTLILSSALALGAVMATQSQMEEMGEQLGKSARENVTELVSEREKKYLEQVVHEKVGIINAILRNIDNDTEIISETAEVILFH